MTYEKKYHQLEEKHWWFAGRRSTVRQLVNELRIPHTSDILEIGCSAGPLQKQLAEDGYMSLTGIDISETAIALAKDRGIQNVSVMDGANLAFPDASFDVVIASDVLEHIQDEYQAIQEWKRVLRPGGRMLIFVPAFQLLWTQHDEINHHYRRYTGRRLRDALTQAELHLERSSYWNTFLFFPTSAIRLLQRVLPRRTKSNNYTGDLKEFPRWLNNGLTALLKVEDVLLRYTSLPVGVSVFAIVRKK
nr:class I SAM-dependent methyltransferase [Hymenobacter defluvii]